MYSAASKKSAGPEESRLCLLPTYAFAHAFEEDVESLLSAEGETRVGGVLFNGSRCVPSDRLRF